MILKGSRKVAIFSR